MGQSVADEEDHVSLAEFNTLKTRLETLELQQNKDNERLRLLEGKDECGATRRQSLVDEFDDNDTRRVASSSNLRASQVERLYDDFELPADTYTLLMTEEIWSVPFWAGFIAPVLSATCLVMALQNVYDRTSPGNYFGVPPGVQMPPRVVQYIGAIVGIWMETEIPNGLEIIGKGAEQRRNANRMRWWRILLPSMIRLVIGYLFIICLFLSMVQSRDVLSVFVNVYGLTFTESIDDTLFALFRRGFFGSSLRVATNNTHFILCSAKAKERRTRRWFQYLIRAVYFTNILAAIAVMTYTAVRQRQGAYRCNSVSVNFGDDISWDKARVDGEDNYRLLIHSHFNGIYEEEGRYGNRPRYVERNKEDGGIFKVIVPAEIVYCEAIESWVLRHPHIKTAPITSEGTENACNWLLRSPNTESYDITELASENGWNVWMSFVKMDHSISIICNECYAATDCNQNGLCENSDGIHARRCKCHPNYFGKFCQYEQPCESIRTERDSNTTLQLLKDHNDPQGEDFVEVYGKPMYVLDNMSGKPYNLLRIGYPNDGPEYFNITYPNATTNSVSTPHKHYHDSSFEDDDFFETNNSTYEYQTLLKNYTFLLRFSGSRWYGQIIPPGLTAENFKEEEYHAFWHNTFSGLGEQDNRTLLLSAPDASHGSPVGLDFYEMRRRNVRSDDFTWDYGPYGVLIPLTGYEGSGWFHCVDKK